MNNPLRIAALIVTLSFAAADAGAHSYAQLTPGGARCNGCHSGGRPPTPGFSPSLDASRVGAGFQITGGKPALIFLDVVTSLDQGLGLAVTAGDGLTLESVRDDTRVERQILGQMNVIFDPVGVYHVLFAVTAPAASCGRRFTLNANVTAVDRNGATDNDGTATTATSVFVDCPAVANPVLNLKPGVAIQPANKPIAPPTAPVPIKK